MASFEGKVVTITGAASGMGLEIAKLLASQGAILSLADMNEKGLVNAIKVIDAQVHTNGQTSGTIDDSQAKSKHRYRCVDVRDGHSVNSWIEWTVAELGKLDGAVNFAGIATMNNVKDETEENWALNMDVNAKGVFLCLRAQLRVMKPGAAIVSAASVNGQIGFESLGAYCASKHAVIGISRCAARENPDIRVNCVAPGVVATPMMQGETAETSVEVRRQTQKRIADPREIANVVSFLLSDASSFVTGAVWNVDGGYNC